MNAEARQRLIDRIKAYGPPMAGGSLPLVTLEDFFAGNEDFGSIGCNLWPQLGPGFFYEKLKQIRDQPNVQDVLVEINEVVEDPATWPFSDRVYILTSATRDEVSTWAALLQPDAVEDGFAISASDQAPLLGPGTKIYSLWWD